MNECRTASQKVKVSDHCDTVAGYNSGILCDMKYIHD